MEEHRCETCGGLVSADGFCVNRCCPDNECWPPVLPLPEGCKLDRRHRTIGPHEDPYSRNQRTVILGDGRRVTLFSCALAMGSWLEVDGQPVCGDEHNTSERAHEEFQALTGLDAWSFDHHFYAEDERFADIREAELAAGWDPNP